MYATSASQKMPPEVVASFVKCHALLSIFILVADNHSLCQYVVYVDSMSCPSSVPLYETRMKCDGDVIFTWTPEHGSAHFRWMLLKRFCS